MIPIEIIAFDSSHTAYYASSLGSQQGNMLLSFREPARD
jgi:hypothetical protein